MAAILLIQLEAWAPGMAALLASGCLAWISSDSRFSRRLCVLLGCTLLLALAPIDTRTNNAHVAALGSCFLLAIVMPSMILAHTDPGVITFRLVPDHVRWRDLAYVCVAIPSAWAGLRLLFALSPEVAQNWTLPPTPAAEPIWRLYVGINAVGAWDETFFVIVAFATLRSVLPFVPANLTQAILYTAVLNDMAFRGAGPIFVYIFGVTQGALFERSANMILVLLVHFIVDFFLFQEIMLAHYPGLSIAWPLGF